MALAGNRSRRWNENETPVTPLWRHVVDDQDDGHRHGDATSSSTKKRKLSAPESGDYLCCWQRPSTFSTSLRLTLRRVRAGWTRVGVVGADGVETADQVAEWAVNGSDKWDRVDERLSCNRVRNVLPVDQRELSSPDTVTRISVEFIYIQTELTKLWLARLSA